MLIFLSETCQTSTKNDTKFQGYRMNSVGKTDKKNYIMSLTVKPKKKKLLDKFSGYIFSWNCYRVNPRPSFRINFVYEKYVFIKRKHSFFALLLWCIYTMLYMLIKRLYIYIYIYNFFFYPTLIDNKYCWGFFFCTSCVYTCTVIV